MSDQEHSAYATQVISWAKCFSDIFEDIGSGVIGFIPNGLDVLYDTILKRLPFVGELFSLSVIEQLLKLVFGITIGQGMAEFVGRFVFRPIGFMFGALFGTSVKSQPRYNRGISILLYQLSGQTVAGALIGLVVLLGIFAYQPAWSISDITPDWIVVGTMAGALLGLLAKAMWLLAVNMVASANAANIKRNVKRAKTLNQKLKVFAKQKAKSKILIHAQDVLVQMNGPDTQKQLEQFFEEEYERIAFKTYKKLDRHFDYLTDRACCGDIKALQKLYNLIPNRKKPVPKEGSPLEVMLNRIFNDKTLFVLKDDVDNTFDRWRYKQA